MRRCGSARAAGWNAELREYVLEWEDLLAEPDPHAAALAFGRAVVAHACDVCGWDPELAASAEGIPPPVV